ncbi:MAG: saccharopine dehydrogenase family protein [Anaerolineales bacterium]
MKIVVVGGAGKMGCIAVQALAKDQRVSEVVIADYHEQNAATVMRILQSDKIGFVKVNIEQREALVACLQGADVCLNASVYYYNVPIMEACLQAGVSYTDLGGLFHTTRQQLTYHERFAEKGLSAVLGLGSAPGIPNVQARYAADRLDTIESIRIYDGIKPPPPDDLRFTYAVATILDEMTMSPMVYRDGEFIAEAPLSGFEEVAFTPPLGILPMHYSLHSEVATLPLTFKDKGVRECFFKINYWGMAKEAVEKLRVLEEFGFNSTEALQLAEGITVIPRQVLIAMMAKYVPSIEEFLAPPKNSPPDWVKEIVTEVKGSKDGKEVRYRLGTLTVKGALPTGVVPAIAAIWLGQKRIPAGVYPPEMVLEPVEFLRELEPFDIYTQVSVTKGME